MERSPGQEHVDGLLVLLDLAKSYCAWSESVVPLLLDASICGCSFLVGNDNFGSDLGSLHLGFHLESAFGASLRCVDLLSDGLLFGHCCA